MPDLFDRDIAKELREFANTYTGELSAKRLVEARRHRRRHRLSLLSTVAVVGVVGLLVPALLGGFGSDAPRATGRNAARDRLPAIRRTLTPSHQAVSSQSTVTSTAPTSPGPTACKAARIDLALRFAGDSMPGIEAVLVFTNKGQVACTLSGWPTIDIPTLGQRRPDVAVEKVTATGAWVHQSRQLVLQPSRFVAATLLVGNPSSNDCHAPFKLDVRLPNGGPTKRLAINDGRFDICPSRTLISVSPIHATANP